MTDLEIYDAPDEGGKDYIVQIRIRNGPLLRAMRMRGFKTISEFARACGYTNKTQPATGLSPYFSLRRAPIRKNGEWSPIVLRMAKVLRLPPDCLFPEQHLRQALAKSSGELEVSAEEVARLIAPQEPPSPVALVERHDTERVVSQALGTLTPREERIIRLRFGINCEDHGLKEAGERLGITRERVRQLEAKGMRKLKHPSRRLRSRLGIPKDRSDAWNDPIERKKLAHMPPIKFDDEVQPETPKTQTEQSEHFIIDGPYGPVKFPCDADFVQKKLNSSRMVSWSPSTA